MRPRQDGWNIVLAGFWNRMIFVPEWVKPRLFEQSQAETLFSFLPVPIITYRDEQVSMEISPIRVALSARDPNIDANLTRIESMARTILSALPETPVHGVGINFAFSEDLPPGHLPGMFSAIDDPGLGQLDWDIAERKLTRRLSRRDDVLNLMLTYSGTTIEFDFNFHRDTATNPAALECVPERRLFVLRDAALEILQQVYHLNPEGMQ